MNRPMNICRVHNIRCKGAADLTLFSYKKLKKTTFTLCYTKHNNKPCPVDKAYECIEAVSDVTMVSKEEILAHNRHESVVVARFMVYHILHRTYGFDYSTIARVMGKTHAAIINGITVVNTWDKSNKFRDRKAKDNAALFEKVVSKLRQKEYAYKFRTTNPVTGEVSTEEIPQ